MIQFSASSAPASSQSLPLRQRRKSSSELLRETETVSQTPRRNQLRRRASFNNLPSIDLRANPKPFLGLFDFDHTLVKWLPGPEGQANSNHGYDKDTFNRTAKAIREAYPKMAVGINTGRKLTGMQKAADLMGDDLNKIPIDYLHVVDGDQHYVNDKHLPATVWMKGLRESDRQRDWEFDPPPITEGASWKNREKIQEAIAHLIQRGGYQEVEAIQSESGGHSRTFENTLAEARLKTQIGITHYGDDLYYLSFVAHPTHKEDFSEEEMRDTQASMAAQYLELFQDLLKSRGIRACSEAAESEDPETGKITDYILLSPYITHKAMSVQGTLDRYMTKPKAVITAGDSPSNDLEVLSARFFTHQPAGSKRKRLIFNYPIISGNDPNAPHTKTLAGTVQKNLAKEHIQQVETGDIGPAIRKQIEQIPKNQRRLNYVI
jgi:hydroxymethylpyrimidine pyrophosphatase-like HAD family hydrolase